MYIKTLFFTAAALGFCAFATSHAHAAPTSADTSSITVRYGDLDLGGPEGAKVMLARIERAAAMVCDDGQTEPWDLGRRHQVRACVERTRADAVAALASPMVTAMNHGDARAMMAALAGR